MLKFFQKSIQYKVCEWLILTLHSVLVAEIGWFHKLDLAQLALPNQSLEHASLFATYSLYVVLKKIYDSTGFIIAYSYYIGI